MHAPEPLPLHHTWPLTERAERLDRLFEEDASRYGRWRCDFPGDVLTWSPEVYRLFGFPIGSLVTRRSAADCYIGGSRGAMDQLRTHAIAHRRGFTIDVEIAPANGAPPLWIRLIAAPIHQNGRTIAIEGVKHAIPSPRRIALVS